jgi:3-isopropylmalate/(R)-2-methylmalate dehydratase small subunit
MPEPYRSFSSKVVPLPAENVDTDQIVPARYLKITDKAGLAEVLFRDWRFDEQGCFLDPLFVLDQPGMAGRSILLVGANFGTGSSREHAPWALAAWGIKAVISTGYADIFRSNALKNGVLPISVDPETHAHLFALVDDDPESQLTIDLAEQGILLPDGTTVEFDVDTFAKLMLVRGTDEIGYLIDKLPDIEAWEAARPARVDTRPDAASAGPID